MSFAAFSVGRLFGSSTNQLINSFFRLEICAAYFLRFIARCGGSGLCVPGFLPDFAKCSHRTCSTALVPYGSPRVIPTLHNHHVNSIPAPSCDSMIANCSSVNCCCCVDVRSTMMMTTEILTATAPNEAQDKKRAPHKPGNNER